MKRLIPLAIVAGLALAGCSANPTAETPATSAPVTASPSESAPMAQPAAHSADDIAKAKKKAIDSGRPENAWDKNCIAWEWPEEKSKGQHWANKLGKEWLKYRGVECPDAIVMPFYDITSFEPGKNGSLVVNYSGNPKWDGNGEIAAEEIMADLNKLNLAPTSVIVRYEKNGLEKVAKRK